MISAEPQVVSTPYRFKLNEFLVVGLGFSFLIHWGWKPESPVWPLVAGFALAALLEVGAKMARTRLIALDRQAFVDNLAARTHLALHAADCGNCTETEALCPTGRQMAQLDEAENNVVIGTEQEIFREALERELGAHAMSEAEGNEIVIGYHNNHGVSMVRISFKKDGRLKQVTLEQP